MTASTAPAPSAPNPVPSDPAVDLWRTHFRDPATAMARAEAVLASADADLRSVAWAELTVAFHHLFFTAKPIEAEAWLPRAERHFATLGERRGELLAQVGAARLMIAQQAPLPARAKLDALQAEAMERLPAQDRFWVLNALGATIFTPTRSTRRSATCTRRWNRCGRSISRRNCRR